MFCIAFLTYKSFPKHKIFSQFFIARFVSHLMLINFFTHIKFFANVLYWIFTTYEGCSKSKVPYFLGTALK